MCVWDAEIPFSGALAARYDADASRVVRSSVAGLGRASVLGRWCAWAGGEA